MKLKNVDIKAFRLFGDEHVKFVNSHFPGKACADFVTIYAPNGFGKTSFFDAIEFCMTNNIKRLHFQNFKENVNYDKGLSDLSSFIHNREMPDVPIQINLGLVDYEKGTITKTVDKDQEISLLTHAPENKFFSRAMLAQDWFSEFLSVQKADARFSIFMEHFHDSEGLLEYHEKIKKALERQKSEVKGLTEAIRKKTSQLKNNLDDTIIKQIDEAKESLDKLNLTVGWRQKIDDNEIKTLDFEGRKLETIVLSEIESNTKQADALRQVVTGENDIIALDRLQKVYEDVNQLRSKIEALKCVMTKIRKLKSIIAQIEKLEKAKHDIEEKVTNLEYLTSHFVQYKEWLKLIEEQNALITKSRIEQKLLDVLKTKYASQQKELGETLQELKKQLVQVENKIKELPEKYQRYTALLKDKDSEEKKKQSLTADLALKQKEKAEKDEVSKKYASIQSLVTTRTVTNEIEGYEELSRVINGHNRKIDELSHALKEIEKSINKQSEYQNEVQQLLNHSREMVEALRSGVCPLCGHDYKTTEELLAKVAGNSAISDSLEILIKRKTELEDNIQQCRRDTDEAYQKLQKAVSEKLAAARKACEEKEQEIKRVTEELANSEKHIGELSVELKDYQEEYQDRRLEQVSQAYQTQRDELEKKIRVEDEKLTTLSKSAADNDQSIQRLQKTIEDSGNTIAEIQKREEFSDYQKKLGDDTVDDNAPERWAEQIQVKKKDLSELEIQKASALAEQKALQEADHISLAMEPQVERELSEKTSEYNDISVKYSRTITHIRNNCKVEDVDISVAPKEIAERFSSVQQELKQRQEACEKKRTSLQNYISLLALALQLNEQRKTKQQIEDLNKSLTKSIEDKNAIEKEINDLEKYLTQYVEGFFQVDFINKLYNQIDPHPDYKKVKFSCDFKYSHPRLNVSMFNTKGDDEIVPNLYLSTAQVNILSFCIFMAKAMFAKTDKGESLDCIFIDDPIQALDDINILSMIDLLRNVAFTMNKQVILTTHDQNFFELLQKKMPQDKFNACYLKLEERGKFERKE